MGFRNSGDSCPLALCLGEVVVETLEFASCLFHFHFARALQGACSKASVHKYFSGWARDAWRACACGLYTKACFQTFCSHPRRSSWLSGCYHAVFRLPSVCPEPISKHLSPPPSHSWPQLLPCRDLKHQFTWHLSAQYLRALQHFSPSHPLATSFFCFWHSENALCLLFFMPSMCFHVFFLIVVYPAFICNGGLRGAVQPPLCPDQT